MCYRPVVKILKILNGRTARNTLDAALPWRVDMHAGQLTVSPEMVRELVDEQFPRWRGLAIRSVRASGTVNAIFRIGELLAARFALKPADPGSVRRELTSEAAAARELAGRTRFPTPEPVALGEPGAGYPLPWSVQTWLPGVAATDEDPGGSAAFAHDLAEFIRDVRAIGTRGRTFSGSGRGGDLRSHDAWMDVCFARSEPFLDVARLRRMWAGMRDLPRSAGDDVMSHKDLIPGNVLVSGGRLAGVIDVGDLGRLTPPWIWSPPGICSSPPRGRRSATISGAATVTGNAVRRGPSSRRWGRSGTTPTATRP